MNINDIAREAGVSIATVSRVLNHLPVREENRLKVEAAVKRLDFVPNYLARGLMNKQSLAIGVLITSISNDYYMEITDAVERRLRERGLMLFLCSTDGETELERRYLNDLVSRRVDGIIVLDSSDENYASGLFRGVAQRVPLILVHSNPDILDVDSVVIDQRLGMRRVMEHLYGLGHREIAFLRGRAGVPYDIKEEAWRSFLSERGIVPSPERLVVIEQGNASEAIGQAEEAMGETLRSASRPTAVFACNDLMARGVVNAASRLGLRIPEDLSVVGHDDTVLAISGRTQLTSVDLKMKSLGGAAVDLLYRAIDGGDPEPRRVFIVPELVVRESTGPVPADSAFMEVSR
jgi:LacI family transcriptional regulator